MTKKKEAASERVLQMLCELTAHPEYPKIMKFLNLYLDVAKAADEGRLSPEALEEFNKLNRLINETHKQACGA